LEETKITPGLVASLEEFRKPQPDKGLIEACSENVVLFSERMLGIKLYTWQVYVLSKVMAVLNEPDPLVRARMKKKFLVLTSRQIGKSTMLAVLNLWLTVYNKYPGTIYNNTQVGVVSATDVQAKKLLYEIRKLARIGDRYMESTYRDGDTPLFGKKFFSNLMDDTEANNTTTITYKHWSNDVHGPYLLLKSRSGSLIKSYPPTSIVLGETFTVLEEDEAGKADKISDQFHDDFASPTVTSTDGITILTSTPWFTSGFFYEAADPDDRMPNHEYERFLFTCDAIKDENPGQYNVIQEKIKELEASGKHDVVQRAYYCRFVKGETSYFDPDSVMDAFTSEYGIHNSYDGFCDIGLDYGGQVTSRTVITVSTQDSNGIIKRLYHRAYPVGQDLSLLNDLENDVMVRFPKWQRIIPDDCPAGDFLNRQMLEKGWNVTPMNFRAEKVKKYGAFRSMLNKEKVLSYQDNDLKTEMLAMEFSQAAKQSVLQHAPGYTDDLIDSFVMSTYYYIQEEGGIKTFDWADDTEEEKLIKKGITVTDNRGIMDRLREKRGDPYAW
jgi:hypothetical protein